MRLEVLVLDSEVLNSYPLSPLRNTLELTFALTPVTDECYECQRSVLVVSEATGQIDRWNHREGSSHECMYGCTNTQACSNITRARRLSEPHSSWRDQAHGAQGHKRPVKSQRCRPTCYWEENQLCPAAFFLILEHTYTLDLCSQTFDYRHEV